MLKASDIHIFPILHCEKWSCELEVTGLMMKPSLASQVSAVRGQQAVVELQPSVHCGGKYLGLHSEEPHIESYIHHAKKKEID